MKEPVFFMQLLFNAIGLGEFAEHYPQVVNSWLAMAILIFVALLVRGRIDPFRPSKLQNFLEMAIDGLENFYMDIVAEEEARIYFPLYATVFFYIFLCNIMGLAPGLYSPTANPNTNLACALVTVIGAEIVGLKSHGLKYIKHYTGPILPLAILFVPIEIIGRLARLLSLTMRLFGNILAEDLVIAILMFLAGAFLAPLPIYFLFIFADFVQAFIFTMLSMMYLAGAIEEAH